MIASRLIFIALVFFFTACEAGKNAPPSVVKKDSATSVKTDTGSIVSDRERNVSANWMDGMIRNYIVHTENEMIRLAVEYKLKEEWIADRVEVSDKAVYKIFQIGHDVAEENGTNMRFVTDGWVYIDTTRRILYEYKLASDTLSEWKDPSIGK